MPRLHFVKKAQKDNPAVKRGEGYWWWKFRYGPKRYSATKPRRSELTQSSFLAQIYDLEDDLDSRESMAMDDVHDLVRTLEDLQSECEDSLYAMPDHLQESSSSGELLQERIDTIEDWISELESIDEELSEEEISEAVSESKSRDIIMDVKLFGLT